jgi:predicted secreted protein
MLVKLLVLAAILCAVWYGARWIARVDAARKRWEAAKQAAAPDESHRTRVVEATETERCRVCGVYMAAGATQGCGRPDCPTG